LKVNDPAGKEIKIKGSLNVSDIKRLIKENLILEGVLKIIKGSLKEGGIKRLIKEKLILKDILKKIKL
jgi:hypothetical protein